MLRQALVSLFPVGVPPDRRTVIFLQFYLDESGVHDGSPYVVVSGFMSSQAQWLEFEGKWRKLLDRWGLDFFHMSDFEGYYGPYSEWTAEQHRDRLNQLLDTIAAHVHGYVGFGLSKADYERSLSPQFREKLTPYHVLALNCFHFWDNLIDMMHSRYKQLEADDPTYLEGYETLREFPAAVIYEEIGKGAGALRDTYQRLVASPTIRGELHVAALSYQPKKEFGALQAADILAYELWKDIPRARGESTRAKRYPLRRIEEFSRSKTWMFASEDMLRAIAPALEELFDV